MTFERLNKLAAIVNAKKYLEVGVQQGLTFNKVTVDYKVAVDPFFRFDYKKIGSEKCIFYEKTSDDFFINDIGVEKFDLIFLDGLHTYDQTLRDFILSLTCSHDKTVWLIDDVAPTGYLSACPNSNFYKAARRLVKQPSWMGDVFKVIYTIHDFFPQFNYATFPEHGQTVIWKETRKEFNPKWNSVRRISEMNYFDFKKYRNPYLKIMSEEQVFEIIKRVYI